jgi:hypothetical protein
MIKPRFVRILYPMISGQAPITLQLAVQITTLVSVVIGFWSLINAIRSSRRQMNAQVFMKYTERYERILDQFPPDALEARFDTCALPAPSTQLTLCVLKYLNLCSEEYYLTQNGYLPKTLWCIWEADLKRIVASPLVRREWSLLRSEFLSHAAFLEFVESIHSGPTEGP